MPYLKSCFRLVCLSLAGSTPALAQVLDEPPGGETLERAERARKRIELVRAAVAPVIDGVLDDAIWQQATRITDLHQFQPVDQGVPSEPSEFYLAYDDRYFYLAARLYDSEPHAISARQLIQGGGMPFDDAIEFILDTFDNSRTGYHFQVNPNGIRLEGVFENPTSLNRDWQGIWEVESRIDELGWSTEVAIPFTTLNFDPEAEDWGFTAARTIARKQEEIAWSSFNRSLNPTTTGLITGIRDIEQGRGLDIIPSLTVAAAEDHLLDARDQRVDPSLNVFYKVTPNLTGALTFNTDFSATEADGRQINLSRFGLFFPEKREFFLQDVDIFSFGGRGDQGFGAFQNGIPFYSRRIGLSALGQPVDLDAGAKLTGRVADWNIGALAVQQGDTELVEGQQVFVARAAKNVLSESSLGAIFTQGDPSSERDNRLAGLDFRYQNTHFSESHSLSGNAWYQQSQTEGLQGDDRAYGADLEFDTANNGVGGGLAYSYFGEHYYPGLGFANRNGIEMYLAMGNGRYYLDDHALIRSINTFGHFRYHRDLASGELQSEDYFLRVLNFNTHRGDEFGFGFSGDREGLARDFEIHPGIVLPAGKYAFNEVHVEVAMSTQRDFAPGFEIATGSFYNGDRDRLRAWLDWRPSRHLAMRLNYDYQRIDLPMGGFDVRLVSSNLDLAFNAKWSWQSLVQYDNLSGSVGLNSRLRWNPRAGEDLYVVVNYHFDSEGVFSGMNPNYSELALKYSRTFRF